MTTISLVPACNANYETFTITFAGGDKIDCATGAEVAQIIEHHYTNTHRQPARRQACPLCQRIVYDRAVRRRNHATRLGRLLGAAGNARGTAPARSTRSRAGSVSARASTDAGPRSSRRTTGALPLSSQVTAGVPGERHCPNCDSRRLTIQVGGLRPRYNAVCRVCGWEGTEADLNVGTHMQHVCGSTEVVYRRRPGETFWQCRDCGACSNQPFDRVTPRKRPS